MFTVSLTVDISADTAEEAAETFRQAMSEYAEIALSYDVEDYAGRTVQIVCGGTDDD